MSAWKKPSRNTWVKQISTPARASALRSMPFSRSSAICEIGTPCMRSITMTRSEHRSQCTSGIASSGELRKLNRSWHALAASVSRFSSSSRWRANSATTSRGLRRRPSGESRSTSDAAVWRSARSLAISTSTAGRSTLTATSRPSLSQPMCTWAIEALATGTRSSEANTSPTRRPRLRSISAKASCGSNGGTWSCSLASSSAMSSGKRSRRVESTWPNLTKIGPSSSNASRSRWPRGSRRRPASCRSTKSPGIGGMNSCRP